MRWFFFSGFALIFESLRLFAFLNFWSVTFSHVPYNLMWKAHLLFLWVPVFLEGLQSLVRLFRLLHQEGLDLHCALGKRCHLVINHYSTITTWTVCLSALWFPTSLPITAHTTAYVPCWERQKAEAETLLNSYRLANYVLFLENADLNVLYLARGLE